MIRARLALVLIAVVSFVAAMGAQVAQQVPPPPDDFLRGVVALDTKDLVVPTLIRRVMPKYTPDAMRAKIQGSVRVQAVVMPDGTVGRARVLEGLHDQLDATALDAVKQWRFQAARLNGDAVTVAIELILEFRLHGRPREAPAVSLMLK